MKRTMNKVAALGLALASVVALSAPAQAEVKLPNGLSFGTTIFADYTSVSDNAAPVATNFDATNGFHVSRAYFTVTDKVSDEIFAKFVIDTQTAPKGAPTMFIKNAYLDYKLNDVATIEAGLGATPWIGFAEKLWGYRYLGSTTNVAGKVFADKNGLLSSADGGVAVMGATSGFNYQVGAYNGEGYGGVANGGGLKIAGRLGYEMGNGLGLAAYYDTESKRGNGAGTAVVGFDPTRMIGMVYFKQPAFTVGGEYLTASDFTGTVAPVGAVYSDANGFSVFAHGLVTENIRLFGRYDSLTPNTRTGVAGAGATTLNRTNTVWTAGVSFILDKGQEVTLDYSSANNGAPVSVTTNTFAVNLLTGF